MPFPNKKRRPIWQPTGLERLRLAFSTGVKISWKQLLAALLVLFLTGVVLPEVLRPVVLIDPVSVPKLLEEQGFTGQVVAAEIADQTASMEEAIKTAAPRGQLRLASDSSIPDIEVPETKLSIRSIVQLLQVVLHRQPPRLHADIVCLVPGCTNINLAAPGGVPSERLEVVYRFTDGKSLFVRKRFRATNIGDAVAKIAGGILSQVSPYVMARYAAEIDHDTATAMRLFETCANNKDYPLRSWFNSWGNVLQGRGELDEAIAKYQKAIELDPKGPYPYNGWGSALIDQGKLDEAITKYQKAIELDPKYASPYNGWGNVLQDQGKLDEAMAKYQRAIELDPKFASPYNGWGNALRHQGKLDEAIAKYQRAIELDPKYAFPDNGWGNALQDQGKLDEAMAKYQKAIELDPKYAYAYRNWARALRRQGKSDQAKAKEEKADELESVAARARQ